LTLNALSSIAEKWKTVKHRRQVVDRGMKKSEKCEKAVKVQNQSEHEQDIDELSNADFNSLTDLSERFLFD